MNTEQKIREALKTIMNNGEVNACRVWKGYDVGTGLTGWHYTRFGQTATYIGDNERQALDWISELKEERQMIG